MATQEIKSISVTIRVPSNLLERIEARVSDRNNRTDVIIGLLEQALEQNNSSAGLKKIENTESQKVLELEQKIHSLVMLVESVRQNITILDNAFFTLRESVDGKISQVVDTFEERLVEVENSKATADRLFVNEIVHDILLKELDTQSPLIQQLQADDLVQNSAQEEVPSLHELKSCDDQEPHEIQVFNVNLVENNLETELPEVLENAEVGSVESGLPETNLGESLSGLSSEPLKQDESLEIVKPDIAPVQESLSYPEVPLFPIPGNSPEGIQPISGRKLSKQRFGLREDALSGAKKRLKTAQRLIDWTREKDPDGIAWKMVETPVPGFVPVDELSSELNDKLLTWMRENRLV
jgi:hypothetical protein